MRQKEIFQCMTDNKIDVSKMFITAECTVKVDFNPGYSLKSQGNNPPSLLLNWRICGHHC